MAKLKRAKVGKYPQESISKRIGAFFLENVGRVATGEQLREVARDPITGKYHEDWHQRLSELRTDLGYTIQSNRDRKDLKVSEYLMPTARRRPSAARRLRIKRKTWQKVLERAGHACEWNKGGERCNVTVHPTCRL